MGFFSVITIEVDNVILNLNNYTISMNEYYHIQQRFFSLITITNGPFENGDGPNFFGNLNYVSNIEIYNGKLGLTSHHAIHSNGVSNLYLHNLIIKDFEVCGIQLNSFVCMIFIFSTMLKKKTCMYLYTYCIGFYFILFLFSKDFNNVEISNVDIGPSLTNINFNSFYSNARFLLKNLRKINQRVPNAKLKVYYIYSFF